MTDITTSGFVDDISSSLEKISSISLEFEDLTECYVSTHGYARLLKARRFGKTYMLKCLRKDFLFIPAYRVILNKEFEIGLQMEHPNICKTLSIEEVADLGPAIVMEYVDGDTLAAFMAGGMLTRELGRKLMRQIVDALQYIHSKQIVHRDLKPSNIMVTHNGHNLKLIDFSLSDSDSFDVFKVPAGTTGYIAPELMLPDSRSDVRCDIYSLGVLMSEVAAATGDRQMRSAARRCMRRNPDERPAGVGEIRLDDRAGGVVVAAIVVEAVVALVLLVYIVHKVSLLLS